MMLPTDLVRIQDDMSSEKMLTSMLETNQSSSKTFPGIQQTGGIGQ